jgi:broad specificity phosphatase PhoE
MNKNVEILTPPALREISMGNAEGMLTSDLYVSEGWNKWIDPNFPDFGFEGGEKKSEHLQRMNSYLESFFNETEYKNIAISTHGGSMRLLLNNCLNPPSKILAPNCSLFHVQVENRDWELIRKV